MLHGRRFSMFLFLGVMILPLVGLDLFGQVKGDKKKGDTKAETKKDTSSKDPTKVLAWKFEKGKAFYQTMTTTTNQSMKVMNNDVTQKQTQIFYFSWTPLEQDKDGKWKLEQKILGVKMDIDIGGSPIRYDSQNQGATGTNASNPLSEFFKALVNASFTVTLDPKTNKITDIKGRNDFVQKLVTANNQMKPLLDKILSEDALREMAEPTFSVVPNKAVDKDATWKKETTLDMGPIGRYKNEYTYTYKGTEKNLDKIDVESKLTYMPPDKTEGVGGLPFRIKKENTKLESKKAKGTILFDREKGRVVKSDMEVELNGTLDIEIGGQQTKVELQQTQTTKIEASDTNPIEKSSSSK